MKIGRITPMMNFAQVKIRGTVERTPYVTKKNEDITYASFLVRDETGVLRVTSYDDVSSELAQMDHIPRKGDLIEAVGVLSVSAGNKTRINLRSPGNLTIFAVDSEL